MKTSVAIFVTLAASASAFAPSAAVSRTASSSALDLAVGDTAPDFVLIDQNGKAFTRSKNKKPLVVYFYPADATPGCTVQAKAFQEEIQNIRKEYKADVVGISGQGAASKQKFASELGLDFSILADDGDVVRKAFGVPKAAFGFLPGRVTYVLDKDGVCTSAYDNLTDAASHIQAAKDALAEMKPTKPAKGAFSFPF
jgi:peroxiredoxin Q/BCP